MTVTATLLETTRQQPVQTGRHYARDRTSRHRTGEFCRLSGTRRQRAAVRQVRFDQFYRQQPAPALPPLHARIRLEPAQSTFHHVGDDRSLLLVVSSRSPRLLSLPLHRLAAVDVYQRLDYQRQSVDRSRRTVPQKGLHSKSIFSAGHSRHRRRQFLPEPGQHDCARALLGMQVGPTLLLVPLAIALLCIVTFSIALLLSVATVYFRDLTHIIKIYWEPCSTWCRFSIRSNRSRLTFADFFCSILFITHQFIPHHY